MDFVEIMQWVAFVATIIGGGWATLKIKSWLVPDPDKMEVGVLVETPFGMGRILWKKGQNIKVDLFEEGEYLGTTKEVQLASTVAMSAVDEALEKLGRRNKEQDFTIRFPDLDSNNPMYENHKGNYTEEENEEALLELAIENRQSEDALQRIERLRAVRLRNRKKKEK